MNTIIREEIKNVKEQLKEMKTGRNRFDKFMQPGYLFYCLKVIPKLIKTIEIMNVALCENTDTMEGLK